MIYTTYFGNLRRIKETDHVIPISIAAKPPIGWTGLEYKKLAPTYGCLKAYKSDKNKDAYIKRYFKEVLEQLKADEVVHELMELLPDKERLSVKAVSCPIWYNPHIHIALVCYEIPEDFCHRHLDRWWLIKGGIHCEELQCKNHICLDIDPTHVIGEGGFEIWNLK